MILVLFHLWSSQDKSYLHFQITHCNEILVIDLLIKLIILPIGQAADN